MNSEKDNGPSCEKCFRIFNTKSEAKAHERKCKKANSSYVKLAINGSFSCLVCAKAYKKKDDLKDMDEDTKASFRSVVIFRIDRSLKP